MTPPQIRRDHREGFNLLEMALIIYTPGNRLWCTERLLLPTCTTFRPHQQESTIHR
jgi:hypothetical protein